jgi:hypothetical protein
MGTCLASFKVLNVNVRALRATLAVLVEQGLMWLTVDIIIVWTFLFVIVLIVVHALYFSSWR